MIEVARKTRGVHSVTGIPNDIPSAPSLRKYSVACRLVNRIPVTKPEPSHSGSTHCPSILSSFSMRLWSSGNLRPGPCHTPALGCSPAPRIDLTLAVGVTWYRKLLAILPCHGVRDRAIIKRPSLDDNRATMIKTTICDPLARPIASVPARRQS
jgi:hypothetical protein